MGRVHALLAVAALLALGGCLAGAPGSDTADATPTPASTTTTATTTTTSPAVDSPATTRAATARTETTTTAYVVDYESLPPGAQRAFDRAREDGYWEKEGLNSTAVHPLFVSRPVYVRYEGERYAVRASRSLAGHDVLMDVGPPRTPVRNDTSVTVVAYANLSERGREAFDAVRTGNDSSVWLPTNYEGLPGGFQDPGFVRYEGSVYRLRYAHGDRYVYSVRVEPVGD